MIFDGTTYDHAKDGQRLASQLERVRYAMQDGQWHTLRELADRCGGSEASISARLRDLRKARFGAMDVQRERVAGGLWRYRLALEPWLPEVTW